MIKKFIKRISQECKKIDKTGFWFPRFRYFICFLHNLLSPRQWMWVNKLLGKVAKNEPSKSEIYQIIWVGFGIIWLILIKYPVLTANIWMCLGAGFALYRPLDIFFAALNWLFVDQGPVEDFRRSLAMFLLNMIKIALFFSITYVLLHPNLNVWNTVVESFKAVFGLNLLSKINDIKLNPYLALFQIITSWFLYAVILGNVVGGIRRGEKV